MNDCLFTRLRGVVEDDNIYKFGELRVSYSNSVFRSERNKLTISSVDGNGIDLKIVGDGYFTDSTGSQNMGKSVSNAEGVYYVSIGDFKIAIMDKYRLKKFEQKRSSINIDEFAYSESIESLGAWGDYSYGDIKSCGGLKLLDHLDLICDVNGNGKINGSLSVFANHPKIRNLYLRYQKIEGDIAVIGTCPKIANVDLYTDYIYGSIEDLVANLRSYKSASGSISFSNAKKFVNVTFNGVSLKDNTSISDSASKLTWTSDSISFT